jgi:hypothetical protein
LDSRAPIRPVGRAAIAAAALVASLFWVPSAPVRAAQRAGRIPALPRAQWVVHENEKPGAPNWQIPRGTPNHIEGFAGEVSAQQGDDVGLYVRAAAPVFKVRAYRLGYYGGAGARLVWHSGLVRSVAQPDGQRDATTNMVEAHWQVRPVVRIGPEFVQGAYVFKLWGSDGSESYVPLVVRDDASTAAFVIQSEVTTWAAYNLWGGYDLYRGPSGTYEDRARIVSFDRPYLKSRGAGGILGTQEQPMIVLAEKLGLDITYWTDVDLHERPRLLLHHRALVVLAHDEYWSTSMREGATAARDDGVNIAIFGANAVYRHVRLEPSPLGADRHVVCYKIAKQDPEYGVHDDEVTTNWRNPPVPRPESALNGGLFEDCFPVEEDFVVPDRLNWLFRGTGLQPGDVIKGMIGGEYDRVQDWAPTPKTVQILAHSTFDCQQKESSSDVAYYTSTHSHAGVLDSGTNGWIHLLRCTPPFSAGMCRPPLVRMTENVLSLFGFGPAGDVRPSRPNLAHYGIKLQHPLDV